MVKLLAAKGDEDSHRRRVRWRDPPEHGSQARLLRTPHGMFLEESHAPFRRFHQHQACLEMLFRCPRFRRSILTAKTEALAVCTRGTTRRNTSTDAWARQMASEEPV